LRLGGEIERRSVRAGGYRIAAVAEGIPDGAIDGAGNGRAGGRRDEFGGRDLQQVEILAVGRGRRIGEAAVKVKGVPKSMNTVTSTVPVPGGEVAVR